MLGMRAYSIDLRQRVLAALDCGMPRPEVVTTFGVSLATLKRLLVLRRATPALAPKSPPGRRPTIPTPHHGALRVQLAAHPDATLATHAQLWSETQGVSVSPWTIGRAIRRLGWTHKKRRWAPPSAMSPNVKRFASG